MNHDAECNAYNAAFWDLGLRWHWDAATFATLSALACPVERIRRYLQVQHPHLLKVYEPEFLAQAIESRKRRAPAEFDWASLSSAECGA